MRLCSLCFHVVLFVCGTFLDIYLLDQPLYYYIMKFCVFPYCVYVSAQATNTVGID